MQNETHTLHIHFTLTAPESAQGFTCHRASCPALITDVARPVGGLVFGALPLRSCLLDAFPQALDVLVPGIGIQSPLHLGRGTISH